MALAQPIVSEIPPPLVTDLRISINLLPAPPEVTSLEPQLELPQTDHHTARAEGRLLGYAALLAGLLTVDVEDLTASLAFRLPPPLEDLTAWFVLQLQPPPIEEHSVRLGRARASGKSYDSETKPARQPSFFEEPDDDTRCIHGMKKRFCAICRQQAEERKPRSGRRPQTTIDLFDLIMPILQPPLGADLDNPLAFPPNKRLYDFQRKGVVFLAEHERALLGDEMGLGKSIQAIIALRLLFATGKASSAIILSPKSVLTDWERKMREWAPSMRVITVRGNRSEREVLWTLPGHVYLTTYETLRQDLSTSLSADDDDGYAWPASSPKPDIARTVFDVAVLDEIQRIKNPGTGVTKAARLLKARRRWGLSGTPLENRVDDVVSIFAFLKPGLLHYDDAYWAGTVREKIRPHFLRRRKSEALGKDFPEKVPDDVWLDLGERQRAAYMAAELSGVSGLRARGSAATVQHVLALITQLKQICNMDPSSGESCKLDYLLENLPNVIDEDSKALIFSQYPNKTLQPISKRLAAFQPLLYDGSLSEAQRDQIVDAFQERDKHKVLLLSVRAGGQGLTLTRANYVYHYDLWWNPAVAAQAEDRAHRIGQYKTVFVSYLQTVDTIEERIHDLLQRKRALFSQVIDELTDTDVHKALSEEELFSLFGLQAPKRGGQAAPRARASSTDWIRRISPRGFEELTAQLFQRMGYRAEPTAHTRDQGIDVYATRQTEAGVERIAVQCKHYPGRSVGVEVARELYGVMQAKPDITKGIIVTSGRFSRECEGFVSGRRIELMDGTRLRGLILKYGISIEGEG